MWGVLSKANRNDPEAVQPKEAMRQRDRAQNGGTARRTASLGQIDRKSFEIAQRAVSQRRLMRGAQNDARRVIGFERLLPALGAQAPAVAGLQPGKADFGDRRRQIIAARLGETKKGVGHDHADGVTADVFAAGVAATVAVKTRHWTDRAQLQRLAKNIAFRQRAAPLLFFVVSQHSEAQEIAML
jgi:hypothetical protein